MVFRSPFPDVEIPDAALTPFVLQHAGRLADKPALVDGPTGRTLTYGKLAGGIQRVAAGLASRGFGKGDVMAIYSPNLPEYALAFHAVATAGGVSTTANPLYTADELAKQLRDSGAKFLLTVPTFLEKAREAARQSDVREIIVFGEADGATPFAALLAGNGKAPEVTIDPAEDLVTLPYSSGTTGLPKGVMLTHRNLVANIVQTAEIEQFAEDAVVIGLLPFYHIYGMLVIMNLAVYCGATVVTMPRFDLEQFLQTLETYGVTHANLVPPIVLALAKHPMVEKFDLSKLGRILSGAAPLGDEVARACAERCGCVVTQGYGMTETSPVTHVNVTGEKPGSVGRPIPNTECRIVDPATGQDVGVGERGELLMRGPQVMRGYLNNPEATAAMIDPDGWLHSGDVAYVDADGDFYVVDRVKELIKYKGLQVAPAELEAVLLTHPAVADCAVIPHPDEEAGEVPKAFVVKKGEVSPAELIEFVAGRVAPYKKVRLLEFAEAIPKSASGKILRRVLVEKERAGAR